MKRLAALFALFFALSGGYIHAQWSPLGITSGLSNPDIESIGSFVKYNGAYYCHTYLSGLQKSSGGVTWNTVTTNGINHPPTKMFDWNGRLYAWGQWNQYASSVLYYSTDGGINWTPDTAGSPPNGVFPAVPSGHGVSATVGDYICILYNNGLQNYWRHIDSTHYRLDNFLISTADATALHAQGDTLWAARGGSIYYTIDYGYTWSSPANNGLPFPAFGADIFADGNNLYMTTSNNSIGEPGIWKSTDKGANRVEISLGSVIGPGFFGVNRTIMSIWARGNTIYLGLGSAGSGESVEACVSIDGGATWTLESNDFHDDLFGTDAVRKLFFYDGALWAQCNFKDMYRKAISVGLDEIRYERISLYPNPSTDYFNFTEEQAIEQVLAIDPQGRSTLLRKLARGWDVSNLAAGQYTLIATDKAGKKHLAKLIVPR